MCVHDTHAPYLQPYSAIHLAIQLNYLLVLLGLFYIYISYIKRSRLHTLDTVDSTFVVQKQCLHVILMFPSGCSFASERTLMSVCRSDRCISLLAKSMLNYSHKASST